MRWGKRSGAKNFVLPFLHCANDNGFCQSTGEAVEEHARK